MCGVPGTSLHWWVERAGSWVPLCTVGSSVRGPGYLSALVGRACGVLGTSLHWWVEWGERVGGGNGELRGAEENGCVGESDMPLWHLYSVGESRCR